MTQIQQPDFSGTWRFCHYYPSKDDAVEEKSEYTTTAHQDGEEVVFERIPEAGREDYIMTRLTIDGRLATGTWHENADPHGDFSGFAYSGAGQMIISKDGRRMEGMWAGAGIDHAINEPRIYTGKWELTKLD